MESTATVAAAAGRPELGAVLLAATERMRELLGVAPPPYERIVRERGVSAVKAALDIETAVTAWKRGRELGFDEAMARISLCAASLPTTAGS